MSTHDPPQFTSAQVLDAARRAEADARNEFAHQLYTHLAQSYPGSPEAGAALQGLARLTAALPQQPLSPLKSSPPAFEPPAASAPPALRNPFEASRSPESRFGQPTYDPPKVPQWAPDEPPMPAIARAEAKGGVEPPAPCRDYTCSRFLARLIAWLGTLQILAGLGILTLAVLNPRAVAGLPVLGAFVSSLATGAWLIAAGVAQIILGQVVRALLEQANATRDIVALMRASAGQPSSPSRRSRRRRGR